ncbi:MAG: biotin--[acetyl-CoA-carboxylase] ligase [Holosporaceae bacterium]|jgi:BirA family biotin operon repressor/biotin-[acetyl-CoA-carboxylase] ligase|nr:biotin--[acetyl-CoA-carboxylase] ligase [Holosporaceae bacterium]
MISILRLKSVASTHKFALRMIESGDNTSECAIVADRQTDAIGRCGRKWVSTPGNLFVSFIKELPDYANLGQLSLTTACAVRESIASYLPNDGKLRLRWPNDVYYGESKMGGILLATLDRWLVISVGVNINPVPLVSATSVAEALRSLGDGLAAPTSMEMMAIVSANVEKWFCDLKNRGFFYIKDHWLRYINEINCKITIKNGRESLTGMFCGVDEQGRLILEKSGRRIFVSTGDVFVNEEGIIRQYG